MRLSCGYSTDREGGLRLEAGLNEQTTQPLYYEQDIYREMENGRKLGIIIKVRKSEAFTEERNG